MPWLIIEPIRQLIYFAFAACCVWISVNIFGLYTTNSNSPLIVIPISVSVAALIFMGNYKMYLKLIIIIKNELVFITGLAFYYWSVVKAVRDEMHESRNKIISNGSSVYEDDENTVPVVIGNPNGNDLGEQNTTAVPPPADDTQEI